MNTVLCFNKFNFHKSYINDLRNMLFCHLNDWRPPQAGMHITLFQYYLIFSFKKKRHGRSSEMRYAAIVLRIKKEEANAGNKWEQSFHTLNIELTQIHHSVNILLSNIPTVLHRILIFLDKISTALKSSMSINVQSIRVSFVMMVIAKIN